MSVPASGKREGSSRRRKGVALFALAAMFVACRGLGPAAKVPDLDPSAPRALDVPYEPTPPEVVKAMLELGKVGPHDVVYDLGCGDGRIVIEAAKLGARGVGVDLDPQRIREARANARAAGVADRVALVEGDLFETDVRPATVVMLFLWPEVNLRLRPRLLEQLRPGARIVSHLHDMGEWKPSRTVVVSGRRLYLWTAP
jgi:precorrin-6B methylase 2